MQWIRVMTGVCITAAVSIAVVQSKAAPQQAPVAPVAQQALNVALTGLDQPGMPGCSVGVVQRGSPTLWAGYGLADIENGSPITRETRFDIGSMSKQFLAMAIFMLEADGKLNLDDEVHKYVPELPAYPWPITLRDMLHHTSGLKDYDQLLQIAGWVDGDVKSRHDILWAIERQPELAFRPGARYSYSDSNYFLLGLIAERVTGQSVGTLLEDRIFLPLAMSHTGLRTDRWALVPHKAWPYAVEDGKPKLFVDAQEPLGDGGIFSTVDDLALWERNFDDPKVGPDIVGKMEAVLLLTNGEPNEYAAGLYVRSYRGFSMIEHSGASYGYLAEKLRFPAQHASAIVLCNRRDGPYIDLSNRLADAVLGLTPIKDDLRSAGSQSTRTELARLAGLYFSDKTADGVELEERHGGIFDTGAYRTYSQTGPLTFTSSTAGVLCRCATTLVFRLSSTGKVLGYDATRPAGPGGLITTSYARMDTPAAYSLSDFVGEYVSEDAATAWCVVSTGDRLVVRRRAFADRPLQMVWTDAAAGPGGILQFDRHDGAVDGFRLRNVRLNEISFRKLPPREHPLPKPCACP
jgi:CubicO group peptidase (beta-lactamase class C family)